MCGLVKTNNEDRKIMSGIHFSTYIIDPLVVEKFDYFANLKDPWYLEYSVECLSQWKYRSYLTEKKTI